MSLLPSAGYSEGSRHFDSYGNATPAPPFRKAEASGYLEYGLTSRLSLIVAPTLAHEHDAPATNAITGSDSSALGARLQLYGAPGQVIALQALVQPPIADESLAARLADGGARSLAADFRLMVGQGFDLFGMATFVEIDPGARLRAAPFPDEARLDLALGVRPVSRLMLLLQDFNSLAPPAGVLVESTAFSKVQGSVVYDLSRTWSVQIGCVRTIAGRNIVRETGPIVAVWYRF